MGRKKSMWDESAILNNQSYLYYYNRLLDLAISCFKWLNLPESIDERFLELTLITTGKAVFFKEDVIGEYLALKCAVGGELDFNNIPTKRNAIAPNGYNNSDLNNTNSVLIYNNRLHSNTSYELINFAKRLANLDRVIDVNAQNQKFPLIITCDENERLTFENLYMKIAGNQPVIYGAKGLDLNGIKVLKTDTPYIADRIYELKTQIWNEALSFLGIANLNVIKKERLIKDEAIQNMGGTISSRNSRLESRKKACAEINAMFNLNLDCEFRDWEEN